MSNTYADLQNFYQVSGQQGRFDKRGAESAEDKIQERLAKAEASGLRPDIAAASARMEGVQLGARKEIKRLHEHLHEGEQVVTLGQGSTSASRESSSSRISDCCSCSTA
jgi:hypothetical protein